MASEDRPAAFLSQGRILGKRLRDTLPRPFDAFLGIPYALSPTGDRRFPRPVKIVGDPDSTIDASKYGNAAPGQVLSFLNVPPVTLGEDCLTVNIFRQSSDGIRDLPVLVYIHGGAYNMGSSSNHDIASMIAHAEDPFLGVSFNYRLGALGFPTSGLGADEGAINLGLHDQILLLEWVQDRIKAFGGDPNNVTLYGLSAGAHSVQIGHHLMNCTEGAVPLFHRVIMESGSPTARAVKYPDDALHGEQFGDFLREVGVPVDLEARRWHKVPVMTGFTTNEGSMYVPKMMSTSHQFANFWAVLLPALSPDELQTINDLYPDPSVSDQYRETLPNVGAQFKRIDAAYSHYGYGAPVRQTADLASRLGPVPVYLFHWALVVTVENGAQHTDNMNYATCRPDVLALSLAQAELARTYHACLTSFITTGNPNSGSQKSKYAARSEWKAYDFQRPKAMLFGGGNTELVGGGVGTPAKFEDDIWARKECEFWWSKVAVSQR